MAIEYDLSQEHQFDYTGLNKDQMVEHLAKFISGLWQIHPFSEGNTRTTAIFTIKYLRSQGFSVNNDMFERHSWYFRNALVRANYRNLEKGIGYEPIFLVRFFRNLLLGENNVLKNRYMLIDAPEEWKMPDSEQAPDKLPDKLPDKFSTNNEYVKRLVEVVGRDEVTIKDTLKVLGLKDRESFMKVYLNPALKEQFVRMKYPDKPNHPRQKYLLTKRGLVLYNGINK